MTDPYALLFVASATGIVCIVGTLTVQWIVFRFAQHDSHATLQSEIRTLKKEVGDLQSKNLELQKCNAALQSKYDEQFSREALNRRYRPSPILGLLICEGHYFCSRCFPELLTELVVNNNLFYCVKCGSNNTPYQEADYARV